MLKQVLRVYNKNDKYANYHECYFLIMPDEYNPQNERHYDEYLFPRLCQISLMRWQDYTSYIEGTADIEESEMYWSEITNYELKECKIEMNRVSIAGRYKLPEWMVAE